MPSLKIRKAEQRYTSMLEIDTNHNKTINYGGEDNPLTGCELNAQINRCNEMINTYNSLLEQADNAASGISKEEEILGDLYTRVLAGAKSIFGVNSDEVEILGGTKKSNRKHTKKENR